MKKKIIISSIIILVLYLILGSILPYSFQPSISDKSNQTIDKITYTSNEPSLERARVIDQNGEALQLRLNMIANAKEEILMSTYEFRSDESGKDLLAALIAASKRGVNVKVVVDGVGALVRMMGNEYFIALSSLDNAQIKVYNPIKLYQPYNLMGRMHDKYILVDNQTYMVGGRNNYDYFLGNHDGYKNYDWDMFVHASKPLTHSIKQLRDYFYSIWNYDMSKLYHDDSKEQDKVIKETKELNERYLNIDSTLLKAVNYNDITLPTNHIELLSNPIDTGIKEPIVYHAMTKLMASAKDNVVFHTPYIIANEYMLNQIKNICNNVPNVIMMTNSVANNGNPFGAMDYKYNKKKILETGLNILEYDGGVSYHGKCFSIDDHISAIGSFNWDMRSAYLDTELMLVVNSKEVNTSMREKMYQYEKDALRVIDDKNYDLKEHQAPQANSILRKIQLFLMQIFVGWLRFLM